MNLKLLDTNIIVGASGCAPKMSKNCQRNCIQRIQQWRKRAFILVIDLEQNIINEYIKQLRRLRSRPDFQASGASALLNELLTVRGMTDENPEESGIIWVTITGTGKNDFAEIPTDDKKLESFDPSDRKWIAAALSCKSLHDEHPEILNASDSDWDSVADHLLERYGIPVSNICG